MSLASAYEGLASSIYPELANRKGYLYLPQAAIDSFFLGWLKKNRKEVGVTWFAVEEVLFSQEEAKCAGTEYGWISKLRVNIVIDGMHTAFLFRYDYNPLGLGVHAGIRFIRAERYTGSNEAAEKIFEKFADYLKSNVSFEAMSVRAMELAIALPL